jgi:hypothetical protein
MNEAFALFLRRKNHLNESNLANVERKELSVLLCNVQGNQDQKQNTTHSLF